MLSNDVAVVGFEATASKIAVRTNDEIIIRISVTCICRLRFDINEHIQS